MNKKRNFLAVIILLLLLITGCTKNSNSNNGSSKDTKTVSTKLFNKMSKGDRSDIKFSFKKNEGTTNNANSIDLTIDNKSNNKVKFNLEDFILSSTSDTHSDKTGIKNIAPNKKVTIKKLFQDVDDEIFENPGLFVYKNDSFKLAYLDGKISKSSNLKDSKLKKEYRQFKNDKTSVKKSSESLTVDDSNSNDESSSSDNTTDNSSDTTKQSDDSTTDSNGSNDVHSGNAVNNELEAKKLVMSQNPDMPDDRSDYYFSYNRGMYDTSQGKAYWVTYVRDAAPGLPTGQTWWTVYPDGTILDGQPDEN